MQQAFQCRYPVRIAPNPLNDRMPSDCSIAKTISDRLYGPFCSLLRHEACLLEVFRIHETPAGT